MRILLWYVAVAEQRFEGEAPHHHARGIFPFSIQNVAFTGKDTVDSGARTGAGLPASGK